MNFIPSDFQVMETLTPEVAARIATEMSGDAESVVEATLLRSQELARELAWANIDLRLENARLRQGLEELRQKLSPPNPLKASCFPF